MRSVARFANIMSSGDGERHPGRTPPRRCLTSSAYRDTRPGAMTYANTRPSPEYPHPPTEFKVPSKCSDSASRADPSRQDSTREDRRFHRGMRQLPAKIASRLVFVKSRESRSNPVGRIAFQILGPSVVCKRAGGPLQHEARKRPLGSCSVRVLGFSAETTRAADPRPLPLEPS